MMYAGFENNPIHPGQAPHAEFLELVLSDEVDRRERASAVRRARAAGLDAAMVLEAWDESAAVTYDRECWRSRRVQRSDHEKCRTLDQIIDDPSSRPRAAPGASSSGSSCP